MNTKLYVGNLPFSVDEDYLEKMFSQSGKVASVAIPTDRETGRKRGFAFVEMENQAEAEAAVKAFDGQEVEGRQIVVNTARPSKPRSNKRW
ncbi:MAG: RNA-binding protein [Candidatus Obscuribacterales bacterium]|nr:RNA-binding protein [Candidatus Obscuribacterales bacterium]